MLSKASVVRLASLASLFTAVLCGCRHAEFIPTSPGFKPHPSSGYPEVFLDKRPSEPYDSVGIIQISGRLSEVIGVVKEKGKELGCDVVVDRRIHQVGEGSAPERPRWVVRVQPLRTRQPDSLAASSAAGASHELSNFLGYPYQPTTVSGPSTTTAGAAPEPLQEFICGIYNGAAALPAAPTKPTVTPGMALWNFIAEEREGVAACRVVADALKEESECAGAQCLPALLLSDTFFSRCTDDEPEAPGSVTQLKKRWEKESGREVAGGCVGVLAGATRSRADAKRYQDRCIRGRQRSNIETRILLRAAEGK